MENCDECNERLNKCIEILKPRISESLQYNSIVVSVGYVSFLTIMHSVQEHIEKSRILIISILMLVSILLYITNEIWKMYLNQKEIKIKTQSFNSYMAREITLIDMEQSNIQNSTKLYSLYLKFYPITFFGSIITALLSGAYLIYDCFVALIH